MNLSDFRILTRTQYASKNMAAAFYVNLTALISPRLT